MKAHGLMVSVLWVGLAACMVFDKPLHLSDAGVVRECNTHQECTERATSLATQQGSGGETVPAVCIEPEGRCAVLLTEDCTVITGDYLDDDAIIIGSMFATTGGFGLSPDDAAQRQGSAILAVEEINGAGGIPGEGGVRHPLVMVSCDDSTDLLRAGSHLAEDLAVPVIVGPTSSSFTINITQELTSRTKTAVMTPSAAAAAIADLDDDGLTFQMAPNDGQRGPLMIHQINAIEAALRVERAREEIRLAILFRDDALGLGTRAALDRLEMNGRTLADPVNLGNSVRIDGYKPGEARWEDLVSAYLTLKPDIIAIAGVGDTVAGVILPIEAQWPDGEPRPYYVMIDAMKGPRLLETTVGNDDLRKRIRGTGVTQTADAVDVNNAFQIAYNARYPGFSAFAAGAGSAYDVVYAVAFALAATADQPPSGASVAEGLGYLSGGQKRVHHKATEILGAFTSLSAKEPISAIGTLGAMVWDEHGSMLGGGIEVWCIGLPGGAPTFQSSGLIYDLAAGTVAGEYTQCAP